jgi:endoribonuclease Dicer
LKRGKTATAPKTHKLAMKTIADVSEALIGASLLTHLESMNMDAAVRAVTELVCSSDHAKSCWGDYVKGYSLPKYLTAPATAAQRDLAGQVEKQHAYHFKYPRLLRSAFTHPSYPFSYEHIPSYQRLEFLGDSLLDLACVNLLYERYPHADPQWLTEHKMAMVSNHFLGVLCVSFGFNKHLLQFSPMIQASITEYVEEVKDARDQAEQDAIREGKAATDCARDYWLNTKQPPKCLPDIIEAYIGALFVDSGFSFAEVTRFFDEHIEWYFADMDIYDTFANKHPVTRFNRFLKDSMGCVNYRIAAAELPDDGSGGDPIVMATLMVHARIVCSVEKQSARYAKVAVAEEGLNIMRSDTLADFREKWGCNCKEIEKEEKTSEVSSQMGSQFGS